MYSTSGRVAEMGSVEGAGSLGRFGGRIGSIVGCVITGQPFSGQVMGVRKVSRPMR